MSLSYVRSVLTAESVAELVGDRYGLRVTSCELVRSLVNEVYALTTTDGRYAWKLYRQVGAARARSLAEVRWEHELATELLRAGLLVPAPVPLPDGALVGELASPEGLRPWALTRWVDGEKPGPLLTDELYRAFGALTARFHSAAEPMLHGQAPIEPLSDLVGTAAEVADRLDETADRELVLSSAQSAAGRLEALLADGMTWGVTHGDVSLDNVLLTESGLALHDFDRSGPGWLARDLTGVRATDHWGAFLAGYRESRTLTEADLGALAPLQVAGLINNLRFHLVDKPQVFGTESRGEGWIERELESLRELSAP